MILPEHRQVGLLIILAAISIYIAFYQLKIKLDFES